MHDVKQDLRRAASGYPPPSFDLEAVRRRRDRREILRRAGTMVTVLIVVTVAGAGLWSAFRGGPSRPGHGGMVALPANGVIWFTEGVIGGRMKGIHLGSVQSDGTHRQVLIDGMPDALGGSTSPDGSTIVFLRNPADTPEGSYGIWTMKTDGSGLTQLTPSDGVDSGPQWSPDGTQILFIRHLGGVPGNPRSGVFVMNADGSNLHALADDPRTDYAATAWSPDGQRILVLSYGAPGEGYFLSVMKRDGSDLREIYRGPCGSPQWSPLGDGILFQTGRTLQLINADTAGKRVVVDRLSHDVPFRWSPDGTMIAYDRPVSPDAGDELHVVDIANGSDQTVAEGLEWGNSQLAWSPDGTQIAFVRGGDIWTVGMDGTNEFQVTRTPQYEGSPVWAAG
jgi:Tol biopolymer transport system component